MNAAVLLNTVSPRMREVVATARPEQGLLGLVHGATLNAMKRHGLLERAGWVGPDMDWMLSQLGLELRTLIRERAEQRLRELGWHSSDDGTWLPPMAVGPDAPRVTLTDAMRRAGVSW